MNLSNISLAQLAAANESELIYMACPMYQFAYYDNVHINAASSQWLGGYYGLVYKRVVIDGGDWSPVQPISHIKQGAVLNVRFHVPRRPLTIDTALVPQQTNYGFSLVDSAGSNIAISSVAVIGPDTVRIVAASSIPAGAKLRYGQNSATGKAPYAGGAGNLRDSQGDHITYKGNKMHNWCVIFEYNL